MNWLGMLIRAGIGAVFGYTMKCTTGACPITSNWWILGILGAIMGLTWTR